MNTLSVVSTDVVLVDCSDVVRVVVVVEVDKDVVSVVEEVVVVVVMSHPESAKMMKAKPKIIKILVFIYDFINLE